MIPFPTKGLGDLILVPPDGTWTARDAVIYRQSCTRIPYRQRTTC